MLKSDGCETDFYLGVRSNDPDRTTGTLLKMLKKTLLGFFPGSRIETFYDEDCKKMMNELQDLMDALEDGPDFLDGFDAELFDALVEKIIVDSNERLRFRLKNGLELLEQIERTRR